MGWKHGLSALPKEDKKFYGAIVVFTMVAVGVNFIGINPMKFLVFSGIVQGFSTPPLMLLIMLMTNKTRDHGRSGQQHGDERSWVGYYGFYLCRLRWPDNHLVYLKKLGSRPMNPSRGLRTS